MWSCHRSLDQMIPSLTNLCHLFLFTHLTDTDHLGKCATFQDTTVQQSSTHTARGASITPVSFHRPTFSSPEVMRYQVQQEEGHDIPDSRYMQRLSTSQCSSATEEHPKQQSSFEKYSMCPLHLHRGRPKSMRRVVGLSPVKNVHVRPKRRNKGRSK